MDIAYISALSVLTGSLIGGLTSSGTTWLTQRASGRSRLLADNFLRRQDLYRDFITAASKAYGAALISNEPQVPELITLYSMISQMRVVSAPRTVACADKIMLTIIDTYFSPNRSLRELRDLIKGGSGMDPLAEFSQAAREEMAKFTQT